MRAALLLAFVLLAGCFSGDEAPAPFVDQLRGTAFGTLVSAAREGERWNVTLDASIVDCERNATRWGGLVKTPDMPAPGSEVGVRGDDGKDLASFWGNLTDYAQACAPRHEADVRLAGVEDATPIARTSGNVRSLGAPLVLGETTRIGAQMESIQDAPLVVRFSNLSVNEVTLLKAGRKVCDVKPTEANVTLAPLGPFTLPLSATCPADARPASPTRLSAVYGTMRFVDELGVEHERTGALWQFVYPGHDARLDVEAPGIAHAPADVVVRARYTDAKTGAPIHGAQLRAWLEWPGRTLSQANMREEGDAYVFAWADLKGQAPTDWPEGERAVVVEAQDLSGGHVWRVADAFILYD